MLCRDQPCHDHFQVSDKRESQKVHRKLEHVAARDDTLYPRPHHYQSERPLSEERKKAHQRLIARHEHWVIERKHGIMHRPAEAVGAFCNAHDPLPSLTGM